ncbi:MAG: coproporphyrinogen III oxidase family protein [Hungatella sp.]|nr:coproporphyrinogen III oxidase family protein [Hungatella sp.]
MENIYIQYMYSYPHKTAYRSLEGVDLKDYGEYLKGKGHGLYLHIPFCQTKCGYCNLFSVTGQSKEAVDRYLDGVEVQIKQYREMLTAAGTEFSCFTIGGGTPLILSGEQLERMFAMVEGNLVLERNPEIVIETAPNQTTKEKLELLKRRGVTRVSMGIQSFQEEELKTLRRSHSAGQARKALQLLKGFDFSCVNLDFIYGIPGQTRETLLESLREAAAWGADEIFLYPLYVKHGAGLLKDMREGMVLEPKEAVKEYETGAGYLMDMGYRQDSMRRFVRKGAETRKFSDCGFGTSLALGCGGRSYLGSLHFCTPYAITKTDCIKELERFENTRDFTKITHGIFLSEEERKRRYVIRHLLIRPGIPENMYKQFFGTEILRDFPILETWIREGFLNRDHGFLTLTDEGMKRSDSLGPKLISPEIRKRMDEWDERHGENHDSVQRQLKKL